MLNAQPTLLISFYFIENPDKGRAFLYIFAKTLKTNMRKTTLSLLLTLISVISANAQGTKNDYDRAYGLSEKYRNKVFYSNVQSVWIEDTNKLWYSVNTPNGNEYYLIDADKKSKKPLFDKTKLSKALSEKTGKSIKPDSLTLERININKSLDTLAFTYNNSQYKFNQKKGTIIKIERQNRQDRREGYWGARANYRQGRPVKSPDGKKEVYIKDENVWIKDLNSNTETALSKDGSKKHYYSTYFQWSPDSRKIITMKVKDVEQRLIYFVESSPKDQLQPKLHNREYTKPGDSLQFEQPVIFDVEEKSVKKPSTELFNSQYDLRNLRWNKDSKKFTFEYNQRGHQIYRVLEVNASTAEVRPIVEETSDTYVNYNRMYRLDLKNGKDMIWMSERDNWNHLYLYDIASGKVKYQITRGEWYVREVLEVDEEKGQIWFTANGVDKDQDPYLIKYYKINLDGTGMTCLTPEEGMHNCKFSSDRKYLVDIYSLTNMAPITVLRETSSGKIILELEKADISALLKTGWKAPETFVAKGRDGKTDMWGLIFRPSNFDPNKKYPVIEYIYSGPGSHYVPKTFSSMNGNMSPLAELGFIVVQLDAMTTSYRSKSFESVCYKNLQDAGFPDRMLWIKAAAKKYPYMDIEKVGIFGASAGGQEAMTAVLNHPEFYKAAYSACGCHDNRMDKIWWNEQWMGFPIDESYINASNVVNAHKLKRPLMLVVGEMDDNVDPASTMQVVDALIKARKNFELVVLPGVGHTMGGSYGERKRYDFFVKHLLGVDAPAWEN